MPHTHPSAKSGKSRKGLSPLIENTSVGFDPILAGQAIVDGMRYMKKRLDWSGTKIAAILHLPANTINTWLKNGSIPLHSQMLHPDVQVVIHLLAIHRSLEAMFENPEHQRVWLATFHPELNAVPEELMAESTAGLIYVRQYLDYVRGRGA